MNNEEEFDFEIEFLDEHINDLQEFDKFLEFAYSEGYLDDLLLQEGIRQVLRRTGSSINRVSRNFDKKIDGVADAVIDGGKKYDIPTIRREILRGRKSVSQILHTAIRIIGLGAICPPLGFAGLITHMFRSKRMRMHEKQALLEELKTELAIIDEKIRDAEADNDRKKKYQYIRLRRELQRGIDQIRFGLRANLERNNTIRL